MATPTPTYAPYKTYTQGVQQGTGITGSYDFLVSGLDDYTKSAGLMIKGNTTSNKGTHLFQDDSDNAYLDLRSTAGGVKNINMRIQDNVSGAFSTALQLTDDDLSKTGVYGATVGGRVKASAFYVGDIDDRTPSAAGVYVGQDASNVATFKINKGTGSGGFKFNTYDATGNISKNNMNLNADGSVQIVGYQKTNDSNDSETTAIAAFDASGNIVRSYQTNQRLRSVENRVSTLETETISNIPIKVNEIIARINGLKFFSNGIESLSIPAAPTPNPQPPY